MTDYKKQLEAAKKSGQAKLKTPRYMTWESVGQCIIGVYVSKNEVASSLNKGTYNHYMFMTTDGLVKFALGTGADKEAEAIFVEGGRYGIEYLGKEKIGRGREVNKYEMYDLNEETEEETDDSSLDKK